MRDYSKYWEFEYIPEIAAPGIPREMQESAYKQWANDKSKQSMNTLIRTFGKLINSETGRYQGTLDRSLLHSFAKKYVADAVRSYDPATKNQLSTHIVNNLQRLHRLNYRNVQGLRASEEAQGKINAYHQAKAELHDQLGRDPSEDELNAKMNIGLPLLKKLKEQIKYEQAPSEQSLAPIYSEVSPEEEALDYIHADLPQIHKQILEYKTGYNNVPIMSGVDIAKKLNLSPVRVSQISESIGQRVKEFLGQRR